jgi:16S rRNA (uracil1498-N3)-methyltransferase
LSSFLSKETKIKNVSLFYTRNFSAENPLISSEETHHVLKVLRLQAGDALQVTDGQGKLFNCLLATQSSQARLQILTEKTIPAPVSSMHLAIAPTKNADRMEWLVEKCTEIGISRISFLLCQRSERKQLRLDRLEKIAIEAIKQSGQVWLPQLADMQDFKTFVRQNQASQKWVAHLADDDRQEISQSEKSGEICLLVGPEGDFSAEEIVEAKACGFVAVSLGKTRLRTETAGLVGCVQLQTLNEKIQ